MTTFGKILVFVNLVFSLVVCALIIMVFISRTNWKDAYEKMDQQSKAAVASRDAYFAQMDVAVKDAEKEVQAAKAIEKQSTDELTRSKDRLKDMETKNQELTKQKNGAEAAVAKLQEDVKRRTEDLGKLEEFLVRAQERSEKMGKEMDTMRQAKVAADVQNRALMARNLIMADKMEEQRQSLAKATSTGTTTARPGEQRRPPPDMVEGLVKEADSGGLVTITIGSDSGIQEGHTLELFRLDPVPDKSMYLGAIRILKAGPNEAVGQPVQRLRAPAKVGDRVASRIGLGS